MIYRSECGDMRMLLAGDAMPARRLRPFDEPDYLELASLVRGADCAFVNLETVVRHPQEGTPNWTQGTPMSTQPMLLDDLRWMGFDIMSHANNHATDYGVAGVLATLGHLRDRDLPCAGSGTNLAEARMPAYCDTAAGRVALVAATSFFRPWNRAADQRPDAIGRPGINPLAFSTDYIVGEATIRALTEISDRLGLTQERRRHAAMFYSAAEAPKDADDRITFLGQRFRRGDDYRPITRVNAEDAEANLQAIREARRQADFVMFSFHSHEFGNAGGHTAVTDVDLSEPAAFAIEFAHAAIDAGADAVAGHGPHLTLGIEIYRGKPICYSLGNFIFQNDNVPVFPAEAYGRFGLSHTATPSDFLDARTGNETRGFPVSPEFWQSFVAECVFRNRKLAELHVHPIDLGHSLTRAQRGRPVIARGKTATAILERVRRLSVVFGTEIVITGEAASVQLDKI